MPAALVAVVGNLHFDILVAAPDRPRRGETLLGTGWDEKCGGKGGNQAIEAARHGAAVIMIGAVGDDGFGEKLVKNLKAGKVATHHVEVVSGARSGMSVAILDPAGDYGAVIVPGANWSLGPHHLAAAAELRNAAVLLLQNEATAAVNAEAARLARRGSARIVLNAAPVREGLSDLLTSVDILVVNAVEAEMMGGGKVASLTEARRAADRLLALAPAAIVTAGAAGAAVAERGTETATIEPHKVEAISAHGAGDAFVGALAARLAAGDGLRAAAAYANAAAAALVSTPEASRSGLGPADALRLLNV